MKFFNILTVVFLIGLFTPIKPQEYIVIPNPEFPEIPPPSFGDPEILGDFSPTEVRLYMSLHILFVPVQDQEEFLQTILKPQSLNSR